MKNKIFTKHIVFRLFISCVVFMMPTFFVESATPITKLQNKINAEEGRLAGLNIQIDSNLSINHTLQKSSQGNDVKVLQEFLRVYGTYPEGLVTGYFGALTERAVKKFQEKESIDSAGIVGKKTRARIIEISQKKAQKISIASSTPEITDVVLASSIFENGSADAPNVLFASTTENIYGVISLKNVAQDVPISYIRLYSDEYLDSGISHPSRSGLKYFHFQWSLKPDKSHIIGNYTIMFYINGKKEKTIHYTIY